MDNFENTRDLFGDLFGATNAGVTAPPELLLLPGATRAPPFTVARARARRHPRASPFSTVGVFE
jgi:hypothetical protein